jgi:hypothetical protein
MPILDFSDLKHAVRGMVDILPAGDLFHVPLDGLTAEQAQARLDAAGIRGRACYAGGGIAVRVPAGRGPEAERAVRKAARG